MTVPSGARAFARGGGNGRAAPSLAESLHRAGASFSAAARAVEIRSPRRSPLEARCSSGRGGSTVFRSSAAGSRARRREVFERRRKAANAERFRPARPAAPVSTVEDEERVSLRDPGSGASRGGQLLQREPRVRYSPTRLPGEQRQLIAMLVHRSLLHFRSDGRDDHFGRPKVPSSSRRDGVRRRRLGTADRGWRDLQCRSSAPVKGRRRGERLEGFRQLADHRSRVALTFAATASGRSPSNPASARQEGAWRAAARSPALPPAAGQSCRGPPAREDRLPDRTVRCTVPRAVHTSLDEARTREKRRPPRLADDGLSGDENHLTSPCARARRAPKGRQLAPRDPDGGSSTKPSRSRRGGSFRRSGGRRRAACPDRGDRAKNRTRVRNRLDEARGFGIVAERVGSSRIVRAERSR